MLRPALKWVVFLGSVFTVGTPYWHQCHPATDVWLRPVPSFTLQNPSLVSVGRSGVTSESDGQGLHLHLTESSAFVGW